MSGKVRPRKTKDSGFTEKGLKWRPHNSGGPRAYSLLITEQNNRSEAM
jgi:hypothetical protein